VTVFSRAAQWSQAVASAAEQQTWDMLVIGGGATGVGIALDAAARGYRVCLLEQSDFGKGTSSRSTKLVHGGVRYLRQGNISLVREALHERATLLRNAPHVAHELPFIIPCRNAWETMFYGAGMKAYDTLAGNRNLTRSSTLRRATVLDRIPTLAPRTCWAGVQYSDGQFDDARLLLNMAQTAMQLGACLLNYAQVVQLHNDRRGRVCGVTCVDAETSRALELTARVVINAAGPFCDEIRRMAEPTSRPLLATSQGIHLVLPKRFLPGESAIIVPKTPDGRVVFLIPWHDRCVIGTTDTPIPRASLEPAAQAAEVEFLLELAGRYLTVPPRISDILGVFTGIRPLVVAGAGKNTAQLSRDHFLDLEPTGLLTITGGKWTTYRKMAQDCVDRAAEVADLPKQPCTTANIPLHGAPHTTQHATQHARGSETSQARDSLPPYDPLAVYGTDRAAVVQLGGGNPALLERIDSRLDILPAQVLWAVRHELARSVEDVLARRTRSLLLDARAATDIAPQVARIMADDLGLDEVWQDQQVKAFRGLTQFYLPPR
jgi:glycerol-3-phosphate dehydrogenase